MLSSITLITVDYRGSGSHTLETVRSTARDLFAPVENAVDGALSPVRDFVGGIVNYGHVKAENERLREELARQRGQALRLRDVERERRALADIQGITFVGDIPTVASRVVAGSPSNFEQTVEIDRGTSSGVAEGMPVVAAAGLVGRITEASQHRATVLLVTDPTSSVGIRFSQSGDVGVARGHGLHRPMPVDLIDPSTKVGRHELVVTSGLQQSVFPPGVPVGLVRSHRSRPGQLQQDVTIDPVVDVGRLVFVKVLLWSNGVVAR